MTQTTDINEREGITQRRIVSAFALSVPPTFPVVVGRARGTGYLSQIASETQLISRMGNLTVPLTFAFFATCHCFD